MENLHPHPEPTADPHHEQDLLLVWAAVHDLRPGRGTVAAVTACARVRAQRLGHRPPSAFRVSGLLWDLAERGRVVAVALPCRGQVWTDLAHAGEVIADAAYCQGSGGRAA